MPEIGEIKQGNEIGYRSDCKNIWHACEKCGKKRWVPFIKGEISCKVCFACAGRRRKIYTSIDEPTRRREQWKRWAAQNPERKRELQKKTFVKAKTESLIHYGNGKLACVICGFDDIRALSIDHINGRGELHREEIGRRGGSLYCWLRGEGYPEGYQTLCMNCQFIKRVVNKECMGKVRKEI